MIAHTDFDLTKNFKCWQMDSELENIKTENA